jgi:hypothetical protein
VTLRIQPDEGPGIERAEFECLDVELALQFGIGSQNHLETPVENETVDGVRTNPTPDSVGCLEDPDIHSRVDEVPSS